MRIKRWVCLILASMLLCGCSPLREKNDISGLPSLEPQNSLPYGEYEPYRATLYYIDPQRNTLSAELREIELVSSAPKGKQIFEELLAGPSGRGLEGFGSEYTLKNIDITGGVANIYLLTEQNLSDQKKLALCAALSNTAVDNLGVQYANLFFNEEPAYVAGKPCGLLGKTDLDMTAFYESYLEKATEPVWSIPVALYFLDESKSYILPEVRTLSFEGENYLQEILYQLSLGPEYKSYLLSPLLSNYVFTYQENFGSIGGDGLLCIDSPQKLFQGGGDQQMRQHMACLYHSFHGVVQGLRSMEFTRGMEKHTVTFSTSQLYLGEEVLVYFPGKDLKHLERFHHVVRSGRAHNLKTYLEELAEGPLKIEQARALPCFPADMGSEGLLGAEMRDNIAVVNFSAEMLYSLEGMQKDELYLFLYAVVNTLCEDEAVCAVQFCFEGEIIDELGIFSLAMPLYPNIGLAQ